MLVLPIPTSDSHAVAPLHTSLAQQQVAVVKTLQRVEKRKLGLVFLLHLLCFAECGFCFCQTSRLV